MKLPNRHAARERSRLRFFAAIEDLAYPCLYDLKESSNELFRRSRETNVEGPALQDALEAWSCRWNLREKWCLETALLTLEVWSLLGTDPPLDFRVKFEPEWLVPALQLGEFRPELESAQDAKARICAAIDSYLEAFDQAHDVLPVAEITEKTVHRLVVYQVLSKSFAEIAELENLALDSRQASVADPIRRAAELLELTLRTESLGGRPRSKPVGEGK